MVFEHSCAGALSMAGVAASWLPWTPLGVTLTGGVGFIAEVSQGGGDMNTIGMICQREVVCTGPETTVQAAAQINAHASRRISGDRGAAGRPTATGRHCHGS